MNIATSNNHGLTAAFTGVFEQFADDASFLWILRDVALRQPHYSRQDIHQLERRVDSHLSGLMTSLDESWSICRESLGQGDPGETFTAAVLAFRSRDVAKIQLAVEAGLANAAAARGFVSALGWLPGKQVNGWMEKLLGSKDLDHKYLALAGYSVRRENPGEALNRVLGREDCRQHEKLYVRALRLIGELKRQDLMVALKTALNAESADVRFWASHSAVLMGERGALAHLKTYVLNDGHLQQKAIELAFRSLEVEQGRLWIRELARDPAHARAVVRATGILGDSHAVNWLIMQMDDPAMARLAGEAFVMITGIELEQNQLIAEDAPESPGQPGEDVDDTNVLLDEDENLACPDGERVKQIWSNHGRYFIAGQRYFMGRKITTELLKDKLIQANPRQRHAAALELALMDVGAPLINTYAREQGHEH